MAHRLWLYHATDGAKLFESVTDDDLMALHGDGWRDSAPAAQAVLDEMVAAEAEKPKRTRRAAPEPDA